MQNENKRPQCQICFENFVNDASLNAHIKAIHQRIKDEVCEVCGKGFSSKSNLKKHKQHLHEKFKGPFKSFENWGLKLLPGIRVIAEGLDLRLRPEP